MDLMRYLVLVGLLAVCTGCNTIVGTTDIPEPVADFTGLMSSIDSVTLTWTAPSASDKKSATLSAYEIRIARSPMSTREHWETATPVHVSISPSRPGRREFLTVPFVFGSRPCYIGVRTVNSAGNKSVQIDQVYAEPSISETVPSFETIDLTGALRSSDEWLGKVPTVLNFWASWCGPCRDEMPALGILYSEIKPAGVELLGMACDTDSASAVWYVDQYKAIWPQLMVSDSLQRVWGVRAYPTTIFVRADGTMVGRMVGSRPVEIFRLGVEYLLRPPNVSSTGQSGLANLQEWDTSN